MIAEAQKSNSSVTESNKMKTLNSTQLPELIKSFELKANQQKDATQVKPGRPAAKMKLRDPQEMLEIARLKVLISEIREKTMKMESQVRSAAEKCNEERRNTSTTAKSDMHAEMTPMLAMDREGDDVLSTSVYKNTQDTHDVINMSTSIINTQDYVDEYPQDMSKNENRNLLIEQGLKLDKDAIKLRAHIENLQCDVNEMLLELSTTRPHLHKDLTDAKEKIKVLQEEIKDDASTTKAQLLLLKKQFEELELMNHLSECKELAFQKASEMSTAMEAEVAELKKGNQEFFMQKQELSKKLLDVLEKAEKSKPLTKDDVLASKAEVLKLRSTNAELQKEVETLQMSRFNEVEEVVYLRWVNACLRHDLDIYKSSCQTSDEISTQTENRTQWRTDSSSSSASSYNNALDYPASQKKGENMQEKNDWMCSPQLLSNVTSTYSSPTSTKYSGVSIHISPLVIPHGGVNSTHSSPLVSPLERVYGTDSSPPTSLLSHVDGSHHLKTSHASPQSSLHGASKMQSSVISSAQQSKTQSSVLHSTQQRSSSYNPNTYNPQRYSLGRMVPERDPGKTAEIQSKTKVKGDHFSKLDATSDMTTRPHNSQRRSGRSFTRSISNLSASSNGSKHQTQDSPHLQEKRTIVRSSRTLSADPDISTADQNLPLTTTLRRHSAASVMEPYKRGNSFESHLDRSNRVVAAFQSLSTATQTKNAHPTFKDLSRRNSFDDKALSEAQQPDKHIIHRVKSRRNSFDNKALSAAQQPDNHNIHRSIAKSTRADFICDLARSIQITHYKSIEQVSAFVTWFDRQDEAEKQEFFEFPDFPRDKVGAMRRATHEYEELQALETKLHNTNQDELNGPLDSSVQHMKTLLEKVESYIQGFKQARELAMMQFTELDIPTYWMLDSGVIAKIKQAALQLAQRFIKQVTEVFPTTQAKPEGHLLLETARLLLQVHNFAGGFDEKTANAFKELQSHQAASR